jgi:signal peptidase I
MKTFRVKAQGDSMHPLLQNGDLIEYRHVPFSKIRLNDIILVYADDILMTHRVIYKTGNGCITRGDNNRREDILLQKDQVLAKAIRFKRNTMWHEISDVYLSQSTVYIHEIQKLETLLGVHKLDHVFIKGVLVSLRYVGSVPRRIYADCDILVHRDDYLKIKKIFKLLGYKYSLIDHPFVSDRNPEHKPELNFVKTIQGIPVIFDVHLEPVFLMLQLGGMNHLYPKLSLLSKYLIERGERVNIKGFRYSVCSKSDQILYLALHIFHHNYTDMIRYQLLDEVIRKCATKEVWKELKDTITTFQLEGYLHLVFILLKKYCKTPLPHSFIPSIKPSQFKIMVSAIFMKRVNVFSEDSRLKGGIERFILVFLLSPEPLWKKICIFIYPETIRSALKVLKMKISLMKR